MASQAAGPHNSQFLILNTDLDFYSRTERESDIMYVVTLSPVTQEVTDVHNNRAGVLNLAYDIHAGKVH